MSDLSFDPKRRIRARTETFEITISGLLTKRADMVGELIHIQARIPELQRDLAAMDRVLAALEYNGDLEAVPPRQPRDAPFRRGQVMKAVRDTLRTAEAPLTPRQIAERCIEALGHDRDEDVPLANLARRVSQTLQRLRRDGAVAGGRDRVGNVVWALASDA